MHAVIHSAATRHYKQIDWRLPRADTGAYKGVTGAVRLLPERAGSQQRLNSGGFAARLITPRISTAEDTKGPASATRYSRNGSGQFAVKNAFERLDAVGNVQHILGGDLTHNAAGIGVAHGDDVHVRNPID